MTAPLSARLRVLAIDDEPLALRQLAGYIGRLPDLQLVAACRSALEAQDVMQRERVDALFCDINMPDLSGMDFVRQLQRADAATLAAGADVPLVVFTTAYSEYAVEGFKVDAVDYLLKPFGFREFRQAAERLLLRRQLVQLAAQARQEGDETMVVRADHTNVPIALSAIRYVQGMGEYLRIYTTDRPRPVITLCTMKAMEERLPSRRFMRIHRSYIVALSAIRQVTRQRVTLTDDTVIPVGDSARHALEVWMRTLSDRRKP